MDEYIEKRKVVNLLIELENEFQQFKPFKGFEHAMYRKLCEAEIAIGKLPAADVAPVVHGRWIHSRYEDCSEQFELVKCSQCNHEAYAMALYVHGGNYYPNCGAKMDGGDNTER